MTEEEWTCSDDDAPEAVSLSTTRQETLERFKKERNVHRDAKEKKRAASEQRIADLEAKKAKIKAAMAQFVTEVQPECKKEVEEIAETKVIKFESDVEAESEDEAVLEDGSRVVVLGQDKNLVTRRMIKNKAVLKRSKYEMMKGTGLVQRVTSQQEHSRISKRKTLAKIRSK